MKFLFFASLLFFIHSHFRTRNSGVGFVPQDFFVIFLLIQYGFHAVFPGDYLRLSPAQSETNEDIYILILIMGYIFLSVGFYCASIFFPAKKVLYKIYVPTQAKGTFFPSVFIWASLFYVLLFVAVQGVTLPVLREYISYLTGGSSLSYVQIRREIFQDTPYVALANMTRQSITAVLFVFGILLAVESRSIIYGIASLVLFGICAAQLNKFPVVYYFLISSVAYISYRKGGRFLSELKIAHAFMLAILVLFLFFVLSFLYKVQYASEISAGLVDQDAIGNVLIYRIFYASNDGLRLWVDYFTRVGDHVGLSNIGIFASLFDSELFSPTKEIPLFFLGNELTTVQVGYLGSSYAGFGLVGVCAASILVGVMVSCLSKLTFVFGATLFRSLWLSIVGVNMLFLGTRELHTALLSGGVFIAPVFILLIYKYAFKERRV